MNGIQEAAAPAQGHRLEPARLLQPYCLPVLRPPGPCNGTPAANLVPSDEEAMQLQYTFGPLAELWIKMAPESFGERAGCVWPDGPAGRHFQLFPILKYRRALIKAADHGQRAGVKTRNPGPF